MGEIIARGKRVKQLTQHVRILKFSSLQMRIFTDDSQKCV